MKKLWRRWIFKRQVRMAIRLLARIDRSMIAAGYSRGERKQLWRDFIKTEDGRKRVSDFMAEGAR